MMKDADTPTSIVFYYDLDHEYDCGYVDEYDCGYDYVDEYEDYEDYAD